MSDVFSASRLHLLQSRLRLLARRDVNLAPCGRVVSGSIRRRLEAARITASELTDQVLDGHPLSPAQSAWVTKTEARLQRWLRPTIRQLELEYA